MRAGWSSGTGAAHGVQAEPAGKTGKFRGALRIPGRQQEAQAGMVGHEGGKGRQQEFLLAGMGGAADPDLAVRRQIEVIFADPVAGLPVLARDRGIFQVAEDLQALCLHPQGAHLDRIVLGLHGQQGKGGKERPEEEAKALVPGKRGLGDTCR